MQIRRATKIVATLGPASSDPQLLEKMIATGVNVVRLNFSHGKAQDHIDRARLVREGGVLPGSLGAGVLEARDRGELLTGAETVRDLLAGLG